MGLGPDILELESQHSQSLVAYFWQNYLTIDLDNCGIAWFALETNRDHSVVFEGFGTLGC